MTRKPPTIAVMKDLDEIIRERTAGLPPGQEIDIVRLVAVKP